MNAPQSLSQMMSDAFSQEAFLLIAWHVLTAILE
jgi:hypothetical protein